MGQAASPGSSRNFTPAVGKPWLAPLYDTAIRLLTSEKTWRRALVTVLPSVDGSCAARVKLS